MITTGIAWSNRVISVVKLDMNIRGHHIMLKSNRRNTQLFEFWHLLFTFRATFKQLFCSWIYLPGTSHHTENRASIQFFNRKTEKVISSVLKIQYWVFVKRLRGWVHGSLKTAKTSFAGFNDSGNLCSRFERFRNCVPPSLILRSGF